MEPLYLKNYKKRKTVKKKYEYKSPLKKVRKKAKRSKSLVNSKKKPIYSKNGRVNNELIINQFI